MNKAVNSPGTAAGEWMYRFWSGNRIRLGLVGALLLCVLLGLISCGRTSSQRGAPQPNPVPTPALDPTLPFPADRDISALTAMTLFGKDAELRSTGAVEQGTELRLDATLSSGVQYAAYRFKPFDLPDHAVIVLDGAATSAAFIGLADFVAKRWRFSGPFSSTQTLALDDARHVSPSGNIWIAVLAPHNEVSQIQQLQVYAQNVLPVASLTATPETGDPTLDVALDASASSDADGIIIQYEWDLDGDGTFELDSDGVPTAQVQLDTIGQHTVSVQVTDDSGDTSADSVVVVVRGWQRLTVDAGGSTSSLAVVDNKPAIAYADSGGSLNYANSQAPDGNGVWATLRVHSYSQSGGGVSLAVVNGNPAVSYYDGLDGTLNYAHSDLPDGSSGWTHLVVDGIPTVGSSSSLAVIAGRPAISYMDSGNYDLKYAISSLPDGSSGWSPITIASTGYIGWSTSLAIVDGNPAISFYDSVNLTTKLAHSSTVDGSSVNDWSLVTVGGGSSTVGTQTSLKVIDGLPGICHFADGIGLVFSYTDALDGSGGWQFVPIDVGAHGSLAVVNGRPAVSYIDSTSPWSLRFAQSTSVDGRSGWVATTVEDTGYVSSETSMAVVDGRPAISYCLDSNLMYAVLYE